MLTRSVRVFSIAGINVRVDASWLLIAALVTWSLFERLTALYGQPAGVAVALGVAGALLFFASVLLHEFAHALEGRHRGASIKGITLFLFGGVTESHGELERPGDEFVMSAVGPYASLVVAGALGLVVVAIDRLAPAWHPVAEMLGIVGWVNVALAVFNMLPGAPLDGGRVLRSAIWKVTGDRDKAVRGAARAGQGLGFLIIALGAWEAFASPAGFVSGLWLAFIGWFLATAAKSELGQSQLRRLLRDHRVADLTDDLRAPIDADTPVADVARHLTRLSVDLVPVIEDGRTVGVLTVGHVAEVDHQHRGDLPAREAMRPVGDLPQIDADAPADQLLSHLGSDDVLIVEDGDGRVVGILTRERLQAALQRLQRFQSRPSPRRRPRGWIPHRPGDGS